MIQSNTDIPKRPEQIKEQYCLLIDRHLNDLVNGLAEEMFEIEDFARLMFIHPTHLSNTIKTITGTSPCGIYQVKILEVAKKLLSDSSLPVRDTALLLTFEPSQFTKWFKRLAGCTPQQYRKQLKLNTDK
ncbi:AraC-type DNA-binding protein [Chitinophaga sp. YR627]|uniref:helix-turn-helix domain-containing protein n=1 Tax=Chitinophaga sp. YR627 TaxID=1881041 RepID=UPI0008E23169|nr:AraC family transcriptional regulator [Chitinophaga sp. YR627]SFM99172.1 AraC-type DNA-binding protein [Chitinophaga sp. YR627]